MSGLVPGAADTGGGAAIDADPHPPPPSRGDLVAARTAIVASAATGAAVLLVIAATGSASRSSWLLGAALMLAADLAGGAGSVVASRACRGAERLAFALLACLFLLWAATRVIWLREVAAGGSLDPTPLLEVVWMGAVALGVSVPALLYVHYRATPSWDGLMDAVATAAAVGALLWMTAFGDNPWDSAAEDVTATLHLSAGAGAAVALGGMFAWQRSSLGSWLGWMVGGAILLLLDVGLSIGSEPAVEHADVRLAAMACGLLASAFLGAAALTRAGGDGAGSRRVTGRYALIARGVPTVAVLAAIGGLAWNHGAPGGLVIAAALILGVRAFRSLRTIETLLDERSRWALTDPLTGVRNRRTFDADARDFMARAHRAGGAAALLIVDLDGFKAVNDTRGHAAGDEILVAVAAAIDATVRAGERVYRLGGDEFVVLVSHDRPEAPRVLAERLRNTVAAATARRGSPEVTASIGVSRLRPSVDGAERALRAADAALYRAKAAGRDRVVEAP